MVGNARLGQCSGSRIAIFGCSQHVLVEDLPLTLVLSGDPVPSGEKGTAVLGMKRVSGIVAVAVMAAAGVVGVGRASAPSRIVFIADRAPSLSGEIYRLDPDGTLVDLSSSPFQDSGPLVSPDGQRVAFFSDRSGAISETPLWLYILREAAVRENGNQLGAVGGRIVAEVLFAVIQEDPESYLALDPGWTPTLPSSGRSFRLIDVLVPE
jgi:hypothetical protein